MNANTDAIPAPITFGSVCSGMEAVSVAVAPLGWKPAYFSEIESAPIAVLEHRHAAVDLRRSSSTGTPLWGDFSALRMRHFRRFNIALPDVLVGGTPCQGFSVAGLRQSLKDDRSNLALAFVRHAHAIDAVRQRQGKPGLVVLWENVPGVLSADDNAFGCLLAGFVGADSALCSPYERGRWPREGMVEGPGARAAWRIFDAQYFGLAQRRERVLLVVCFRNGPDPAAILFERGSMRGNFAPRREPRQGIAASLTASSGGISEKDGIDGRVVPDVAWALQERDGKGADSDTKDGHLIVEPVVRDIAPTLSARTKGGGGLGTDFELDGGLVAFDTTQITSKHNRSNPQDGDPCHTLAANGDAPAIAFSCKHDGRDATVELAPTMRAMNSDGSHANGGGQLAVAIDLRNGSVGEVSQTLQAAGLGLERGANPSAMPHTFAVKPSHYTRGKDGAPCEIAPPLSADADKGDQEPVLFSIVPQQNNEVLTARPSDYAQTLSAKTAGQISPASRGGDVVVEPMAFKPNYFTREDGRSGAPDIIAPPLLGGRSGGDQSPMVFQTRIARNGRGQPSEIVPALNGSDAGATSDMRPVVFVPVADVSPPMNAIANDTGGNRPMGMVPETAASLLVGRSQVRRLMPVECERLQGFPDKYSLVPFGKGWMSDSARYRMLGNSMAVPKIRWVCARIDAALKGEL